MSFAILLDTLKLDVAKAMLYGDFLLSTNRFSEVWIGTLNTGEVRKRVCDLLANFWRRYLEENKGNYLLVNIEQFEETPESSLSINAIAKEAVEMVNHPDLHFENVFVDPDSFEVSIAEHPQDVTMLMFVEPSVPHDLLIVACKHLQELGYTVKEIITPVERKQSREPEIRNDLQLEFIPFLVYEEQHDKLYTITELNEEPYSRYHDYFL